MKLKRPLVDERAQRLTVVIGSGGGRQAYPWAGMVVHHKPPHRFGLEFAVRRAPDCSQAAHFWAGLQPSNVEAIRILETPRYIYPV